MRPSLGYSNLYWSNKDREERKNRLLKKAPVVEPLVEQTDFQELLENNTDKTKPTLQEEEKLSPPVPTHFPIARIEK